MLAGCGGSSAPPQLSAADAGPLITLAGKIAGEDECGQARDIPALTRKTIALVNSGRVPAALQEQLVSGVNDLASQAPACVRTVPAPATQRGKAKGHDRHGKGERDK